MSDEFEGCELDTFESCKASLERVEHQIAEKLGIKNHFRYELMRRDLANTLVEDELVADWHQLYATYISWLVGTTPKTPGQLGYDAYGADASWKTYDNKEMPRWTAEEAAAVGAKELTEVIKARWEVASRAIMFANRRNEDIELHEEVSALLGEMDRDIRTLVIQVDPLITGVGLRDIMKAASRHDMHLVPLFDDREDPASALSPFYCVLTPDEVTAESFLAEIRQYPFVQGACVKPVDSAPE
jgi:hypothetical protein